MGRKPKTIKLAAPKRKYTRRKPRTQAYLVTSDYEITNLVPPPNNSFPFDRMEPGDSFTFPINRKTAISTSASQYKKKNKGWNYTIRGDRIWRIE